RPGNEGEECLAVRGGSGLRGRSVVDRGRYMPPSDHTTRRWRGAARATVRVRARSPSSPGRAAPHASADDTPLPSPAMVPKADLHVHLEGTATPHLVRRIAERNGLEIPEGVFAAPDRFAWRDFLDFLNTYNLVCSVIRTGEDYRDITYEYLSSCARDG